MEFEGATYHVMCRGDRREKIFEDDRDRVRFLETLAEVCQRTGWKIHGYVLMSNHYHWLLETPQANLVNGMRWFQSCFTARYNRRHGKAGHLFQGRYKAMLIEPGQNGRRESWNWGKPVGVRAYYRHNFSGRISVFQNQPVIAVFASAL